MVRPFQSKSIPHHDEVFFLIVTPVKKNSRHVHQLAWMTWWKPRRATAPAPEARKRMRNSSCIKHELFLNEQCWMPFTAERAHLAQTKFWKKHKQKEVFFCGPHVGEDDSGPHFGEDHRLLMEKTNTYGLPLKIEHMALIA